MIDLPERITLMCDLYQEEAVQAFEILQDAGFFITIGHYKDSAEWACPRVYAGQYSANGLEEIRDFAEIFGPVAKEKNYNIIHA